MWLWMCKHYCVYQYLPIALFITFSGVCICCKSIRKVRLQYTLLGSVFPSSWKFEGYQERCERKYHEKY
ncbi:unnamed protein product [Phytomonas sp. Hart1]|nr:unnamed protein product [Phytomonas sp. Hart1]|eukprot:CCW70412.1 unnamed protein product [Phytomonas sp. isolate Hart1]